MISVSGRTYLFPRQRLAGLLCSFQYDHFALVICRDLAITIAPLGEDNWGIRAG